MSVSMDPAIGLPSNIARPSGLTYRGLSSRKLYSPSSKESMSIKKSKLNDNVPMFRSARLKKVNQK